jgi:Rod binding domain-containing protein
MLANEAGGERSSCMKITGSTDPLANEMRKGARPDPKVVARQFAALFNSMMLRSMRRTVPENPMVPPSMGEKIYTEMLDGEYAKLMTGRGTLGLADLILKQIQGEQEQNGALRELRGLRHSSWMSDPRFVPRGRTNGFGGLSARVARWEGIITEAGSRYNVDTNLIKAVVAQESAGDPYAVSHAGAKGLMQLIDPTAKEMGVRSVFNPRDNVMGGVRYLHSMLNRFHGDVALALASYNAGPGAVDRYNGIPPYPETQNYVQSVLRMRDRFADDARRAAQQDVATRK